ncbi:hypothetical protein J5N97_012966 [Dioscorea zingiberensis]|uniref:Uncharacterized protein n=1 Tax=Dioscorea zingiberensis TaxID=325984 RepID=A0A9D5HIM0_9LILI|nr:hypothetical protein J5N97_012966 [Dioscorea zingiberensis]
MEVEDDVVFADLSKQIALLIMEDDDDEFPLQCPNSKTSPQLKGFARVPQVVVIPPIRNIGNHEAPFRRESKGTGVFIPPCSYPKKKNKSSRENESKQQIRQTNTMINQQEP